MTPAALLLFALAGLCVAFALLWALCRRVDNYGFVDAAWALSFGVLAGAYAWCGPGWLPRNVAVAVLAGTWSARLGTHLLRRLVRHHPVEDGRYVQLRRDWSAHLDRKMFGFFQLQAGSVLALSLPFLVPTFNRTGQFHFLEIAGALVWLGGWCGEALADLQLAAFKRGAADRAAVCDRGLWRYSRHPNYFFEWVTWVGFAVFALGSPYGWIGLLSPAAILYLLLRVTGIPLTEEQAVRSKGEAYRRYQATTSAFVPWWPRKPGA